MQPPRSAELTRSDGGLARYRSAPATWLEALLESDEEQPLPDVVLDTPKPPPPPPPNASAVDVDLELLESAGGGGFSNFLRMNSSPAEFLSLLNNSEGFFSNLGIPSNYELLSAPAAKRARDAEDLDKNSPKRSSSSSSSNHSKGEKGRQFQGGTGRSLDAEMERLLEDSVMCRARAKRGCATHPRSIAERERRTRISDRIRRLQELVPNMDKQTNTADMLEEAVSYVKHLQKEIQELTEHQKKCRCSIND
ncbi:hypothetical protein C2S51_038143 [Perilla frutescens var. frutescens]|nr:hypothetical protein C2S51_038143 [Perilla frutescens var. frutescens]